MKKSLLALAVLGLFAGAASAQSSVTLYGKIDLGGVPREGGGRSEGRKTDKTYYGGSQAVSWGMSHEGRHQL